MKRALFVLAALVLTTIAVFAAGQAGSGSETTVTAGQKLADKDLPLRFATPAAYNKATGNTIESFQESPILTERVKAGELPSVEERLPTEPAVVEPLEAIGKYGGELVGPATNPNNRGWDVLEMRLQKLLTFDVDYQTVIPNIAKAFELSADKKTVTIWLREGMKWSDGQPFTTDDFQFWVEDVIGNKDLTPRPNRWWAPGGELVKFEKVDDYQFKWHFAVPHPAFILRIAGEPGDGGYRPKHYMKQFHIKHNPKANDLAKAEGFDSWVQLYQTRSNPYDRTPFHDADLDPYMPTVFNYVFVEKDSFGNKYFERNPYFWKVDIAGNQLPYVDGLRRLLVENLEVQDLKGMAGEYSHYGWGKLPSYPVYKENEETGGYRTALVTYYRGGEYTYSFNWMYEADPALAAIFADIRFRQAMSLAINREEINNLIYFGRATPRQASPTPDSAWYEDWMGKHYAEYDPAKANKLLDEMGLDKRDADGYRLRSDGKQLFLNMELGVPEESWQKNAELVAQYWEDVGIRTNLKMIQANLFRDKREAGGLVLHAWGYDVTDGNFLSGGTWRVLPGVGTGMKPYGDWLDTDGEEGIEPPAEIKKLQETYDQLQLAEMGSQEYVRLGKAVFTQAVENLWAIGTVGLPPQPLLIKKNLKNTPKDGTNWSWSFRQWVQYLPEQFYFE